MSLLSFRKYAKHRGVSPEAVSRAVKSGRITTKLVDGKRLIDPALADSEWAGSTDPSKVRQNKTKSDDESSDAGFRPGGGAPSYAQANAIYKTYAAKLAKLDFDEKSGRLIDAEKANEKGFVIARRVRDALYNIPDRISHELSSYGGDPAKIHEAITRELDLALEGLFFEFTKNGSA